MRSLYLKSAFYLTLAGVLFSGYLSGKKLLTHTCAFNETCPYFLGYPACWFGFGMFLLMFITSIAGLAKWIEEKTARTIILIISILGILFAGQYVVGEVQAMLNGANYGLVLPTCAYGLIFFVIIFIISLRKAK